jgi:Caenorhabditis protein of unknown function, DUF268
MLALDKEFSWPKINRQKYALSVSESMPDDLILYPRWKRASLILMNSRFLKKQSYVTGFHPRIFFRSLAGMSSFVSDLYKYQQLNRSSAFQPHLADMFPILSDRKDNAGTASGHYFHQDLWAAKKIFNRHPEHHIDIGSRLDGFVAHLLVFMSVTVVDIRQLKSDLTGLKFLQDDATELSQMEDNSIDSISTLHAAEHFGLGRYSDPIDPQACFNFMRALQRVLAPNGRLYFSVPIGRERVEFNAHRVFAPTTILENFSALRLVSFSFVGDDGRMYEDVDVSKIPESELACGLFEFTKQDG